MAFDTRFEELDLVLPLNALAISATTNPAPMSDLSDHHDMGTLEELEEEDEEGQDEETDLHDIYHSRQAVQTQEQEQEQEQERDCESDIQKTPSSNNTLAAPSTARPHNPRRATDPVTPTANHLTPLVHLRPAAPVMGRSRNRSPYSRSHLRSRSSNSSLGYPMIRSYSSPVAETLATLPELHPLPAPSTIQEHRPASPMDNPYARRASPRRSLEEPFVFSTSEAGAPSVPTIEEHAELSLSSPTPTIPEDGILPASPQPIHSTFPRSRRRPASPLYSLAQPPRIGSPGHRTLHYSASVPVLSQSSSHNAASAGMASSPASKYNEAFPMHQTPSTATAAMSSASSVYSLSMSASAYSGSMPSTPTSIRSRSPSVSSLGTIPDSPDAEEEAMERERIDTHERLERLEKLNKIVGNREGEDLGRRMLGSGKERKRWSVCGAERRGDLEMETIWED